MNHETKRLILQYKEYLKVTTKLDQLNNELLRLKILSSSDTSVANMMREINILKNLQSRISDEMSFKDPIVWIEYKYYAYKKTGKDISTVADLIQHCMPEDYVCTKRFKYLKRFVNIDSFEMDMDLIDFIKESNLLKLLQNVEFMEGWQMYEYYVNNGEISKWKNYSG